MPPKLDTRNVPQVRLGPALEIKLAAGTKAGEVEGYASAFGGPPDAYGDVIEPGAFARTIREHRAEDTSPVMLWSHDQSEPMGRWTEMREDSFGLFVRGSINLETTRGRDAYAHLKAGDVNGLSIGIFIAENGQKRGAGGTRILTDVDLAEISVVALPANRRSRVTLASKSELEDLLHKSGLPKAAASRLASGGWPALAGADPDEEARQYQIAASRIERLTEKMRTGR